MTSANNLGMRIIDLARPHLRSGDCLIVTGYLSFLSSLSLLMRHARSALLFPDARYRIAYGADTSEAYSRLLTPDEMKAGILSRSLPLLDDGGADALEAAEHIRSGRLQIRVYDPDESPRRLGRRSAGILHAKIISSPLGTVAGSANFSRAGMHGNVEFADNAIMGSPEDAARKHTAEKIWDACSDWNDEALEILDSLLVSGSLRSVISAIVREQKGFAPWRAERIADITGRAPLPHQVEMVYEASSIAYEHGFVFVQGAAGSGKTDVGKFLGHTLARTWDGIIPEDGTGRRARRGAAVIVPAKVVPNWIRNKPREVEVIRDTYLDGGILDGEHNNAHAREVLAKTGIHILDESHKLVPSVSDTDGKRSAVIEFADPSWTVCLSATLLGNKDVDAITYLKETRASLYMTPEWLEGMSSHFESARKRDENGEPLAMDNDTRQSIARMVAPFTVVRQRADIGVSEERAVNAYAPFTLHPAPETLSLTQTQDDLVKLLISLLEELGPGKGRQISERGRMGHKDSKMGSEGSLNARNLLNLMRSSSQHALNEMRSGNIGRKLRIVEAAGMRRGHESNSIEDLWLKGRISLLICEKIEEILASPELLSIDVARFKYAEDKARKHARILFLAERTDTLEIFAQALLRAKSTGPELPHKIYLIGSGYGDKGSQGNILTPEEKDQVRFISEGRAVEREIGMGAPDPFSPAAIFLTYAMAEGINLQTADAMMFLGVSSNITHMIQGAARIDRIDSPHKRSHYYINQVRVSEFASDRAAAQRVRNLSMLLNGGAYDFPPTGDEAISAIGEYLNTCRTPHPDHLHDVLTILGRETNNEGKDHSGKRPLICVLPGSRRRVILSLRGVENRNSFAPPRLVMIDDGRVVGDQLACAQAMNEIWSSAKEGRIEEARPFSGAMRTAVREFGEDLRLIRPWHLRPARTVSLLRCAARLISPFSGEDADEEVFGDLSLAGIEFFCETWARLLAPHWNTLKRAVKVSADSAEDGMGYVSPDMVARLFAESCELPGGDKEWSLFREAIYTAREMPRTAADEALTRVSAAVFVLSAAG